MNLYFIALIPHLELREQVRSLKEEMKNRFNAKHALKSPAHITLKMPFKRKAKDERHLIDTLQEFATQRQFFTVEIFGFDCFRPRVIFVKIKNHTAIRSLHSGIKIILKDELSFKEEELTKEIHPHITIATRDLTEDAFIEACPEFKKRKFEASFLAKSLFLLKHNGKYWDIYKEFMFQE